VRKQSENYSIAASDKKSFGAFNTSLFPAEHSIGASLAKSANIRPRFEVIGGIPFGPIANVIKDFLGAERLDHDATTSFPRSARSAWECRAHALRGVLKRHTTVDETETSTTQIVG